MLIRKARMGHESVPAWRGWREREMENKAFDDNVGDSIEEKEFEEKVNATHFNLER